MNISIDTVNSGRIWARAAGAAMAALCGIALTSVPAADDPFNQPLTKVVSYADLNLDAPAGAAKMYERLRQAARKVCEPLEGRGVKVTQWRACTDQAIARAIEQVDKPALTAYHRAHTGRTGPADTRLALAKRGKKDMKEE